ncbi:MAG TPA: hypothetical protein V6D07_18505 [Trichocoleus sp.]
MIDELNRELARLGALEGQTPYGYSLRQIPGNLIQISDGEDALWMTDPEGALEALRSMPNGSTRMEISKALDRFCQKWLD